MAEEFSNDNAALAASQIAVGHGHAALLLVESLIHSLIDLSVISTSNAVELVATAVEVKEDIIAESGSSAALERALILLQTIGNSLKMDVPRA